MTWANKLAFFLICVTIIFTTLAYGTVHQPILAFFYIIIVSIMVLWAIDGFISGTIRFSRSFLQLPLLAAGVYGLIQVIPIGSMAETAGISGIPNTISLDPFATQVSALHFLALFIFFAASLVFINSATRLRKVVAIIAVFGFIYSFFAILQSFLSPGKIYGLYETRFAVPFGSFVNRHNFAAYMEMTMCIPLGLLFVGAVNKDKRLLYITAIALMGVALLLSGSRGGFVALLGEVILLIILTTGSKKRGSLFIKTGLAVGLIAAIVAGSVFVGGESSLTRLVESASSNDVTTDRAHIWNVTLDVIANNLPLGAGFGAFGVAYTPFDDRSGLERVEQAHNDYLQAVADAGVVGIVIGGFLLFWLFRLGLKAAKTGNTYRRGVGIGALAGCFGILIHSIFDFVLHTTAISVIFVILMSLIVASLNRYEDDIEDFDGDRKYKRKSASVASISRGRQSKI